jgi:hypothetical protein
LDAYPIFTEKRYPSRHRATIHNTVPAKFMQNIMNFGVVFFPRKVSILMYDGRSLRKIWLKSVTSSNSRLRFAEEGPRNLPIRTHRSLLKSGSQLLRKSER